MFEALFHPAILLYQHRWRWTRDEIILFLDFGTLECLIIDGKWREATSFKIQALLSPPNGKFHSVGGEKIQGNERAISLKGRNWGASLSSPRSLSWYTKKLPFGTNQSPKRSSDPKFSHACGGVVDARTPLSHWVRITLKTSFGKCLDQRIAWNGVNPKSSENYLSHCVYRWIDT